MMEIVRCAPQTCCVNQLLNVVVRKKFTKADVIKRIMKEQKAIFGALLETKREKTRRLKLEKKGVIGESNVETTGDSELAWMLRVSTSRLQLVKLDSNPTPVAVPSKTPCLVKAKKDTELTRVQTRIIQKTSGLKRSKLKMDRTNPAMILDNGTPKSLPTQKVVRPEIVKSETTDPALCIKKNLKGVKIEKKKEKSAPPMVLSSKDILENMTRAVLYGNKHTKLDAGQSSQILSLSPTECKEYSKLPSVTHILNATMSENAKKMLELWMARMINQLGQEGFDAYKKGLLQNGRLLHSVIDGTLRNSAVQVPEHLQSCFKSVKVVLDQVENVRAIESHVVHRELGYRGVVDCVASYGGNLCLIDWKKSDKTKHLLNSTYDAPLQIASYIGALNADENYPFQIKSGLLVIAYTLGDPPTVFTLDGKKLTYYWNQWISRLKKYYAMQNT